MTEGQMKEGAGIGYDEHTIEESIKIVILQLAQLEKVLARPRTFLRLEIDHQLPEGGFEHDRHGVDTDVLR